jgi:hypothetical protein
VRDRVKRLVGEQEGRPRAVVVDVGHTGELGDASRRGDVIIPIG